MKPNSLAALAGALMLGAVLGGGATYFWSTGNSEPSAPAGHGDSDHDEHEGHDEHESEHEKGVIELSPEQLREFEIEVRSAEGGQITSVVTLSGEIVLNADHVAHIVPRLSGIVTRVDKRLGDEVTPGEVMAVLESRELAEAKADCLAAEQRLVLAETMLVSSESLKQKGIMPELDFLAIRKERDEAGIELRAAQYRLRALGLTNAEIAGIPGEDDAAFSRYLLRAPFSGTVIEKHAVLGELVTTESDLFALADLSNVWAHLTVYQKDLTAVRVGCTVAVSAGDGAPESMGTIEYVSPLVEEATRAATARVVLANGSRRWRPGVFITGRVYVETMAVRVLVPRTAVLTVDGQQVVFVQTDHGFELQAVTVGRSDERNVEITEGLQTGDRYVASGGFSLKAELGKEAFAGQGHQH